MSPSSSRNASGHPGRVNLSWCLGAALCGLAFATTAVLVYCVGLRRETANQLCQAEAVIHVLAPDHTTGQGAGPREPQLTASTVRQHLLTDRHLRRVLGRLSRSARASLATVEDLKAAVGQRVQCRVRPVGPGRYRIAFCASSSAPRQAVELANSLAKHYADQRFTRPEASARQAYHEAKSAARAAGQQMEKAQARLQAFLEKQFAQAQEASQDPPAEKRHSNRPVAKESTAATSEPNQQDQLPPLDAQRHALLKQRARLLEDRTPAHPEIRLLDALLAELERKRALPPDGPPGAGNAAGTPPGGPLLRPPAHSPAASPAQAGLGGDPAGPGPAALPPPRPAAGNATDGPVPELVRRNPQQDPAATPPAGRGTPVQTARVPAAGASPEDQEAQLRQFQSLKQSAAEARQRFTELARAEHAAWQRYVHVPQVNLRLASPTDVVRPPAATSRLLWLALSTALGVSLGVGMMWLSGRREAILETVDDVKALLSAPILGTLPATAVGLKPLEPAAPSAKGRRVVFASGFLLAVACLASVAHALGSW